MTERAPARRPRGRRSASHALALGLAALATTAAAATVPTAASAVTNPPLSGVDLSNYHRVGRYDLPTPANTDASDVPANSLLAQEASAVAYDPDDNSLYVAGDGGTSIVRVSLTGELLDSMTLAPGDSPAGTTFYDTEGLTYVGGGRFVMTEERDRQLVEFTYTPGGVLTRDDAQTVKLGRTIGNIGLEGVSWDPTTQGFIVVKEKQPESIFATTVDFAAGTASNGSPTADESADLFDPSRLGTLDLSDVFALSNVSTLDDSDDTSHLLVLSQESGRIVNTDRDGNVENWMTIRGDSDNALSVPDQTHEGISMDRAGDIYVVSEQGGGTNVPQLWVYAPAGTPDQAPSAVDLGHQITSLPESTSTASRIKVADVDVTDEDGTGDSATGFGNNNLTLTGPDAADFEVDSNGLYLRAGTRLDFATKTSYSVSVQVDDPTVGSTPDATSDPYTLNVTSVPSNGGGGTGSGPAKVAVTEVSSSSSGNASYAADWWELTNTGSSTVDLTGWRMDDNSDDPNNAVALNGVSSLAPGQSAIFVEGDVSTAQSFEDAWFVNTIPAGFTIGWYEGSGVGLSTGGDEVNIFDADDNHVAGVAFGDATDNVSFDNTAGAGSGVAIGADPTISAFSAAGTNGAWTTTDGEIGSPGVNLQPMAVTEVSPFGSGNDSYRADWWELTNEGTAPMDLTGWAMDDSSDALGSAVGLNGVSSIAPGQSVVFIEGDASTADAFKTAWFGSNVPAGFTIGWYEGSGVGLSNGGDEVNIFDAHGDPVTGVAFGDAAGPATLDNTAAAGGTGDPRPTISTPSAVAIDGGFTNAGGETGSPGTTRGPLAITEVAPWGSGNATYAADWWEVTNTGPVAVDLTGWAMDDSSDDPAKAVALNGVSSIAPGESVVFVEGTQDTATAFERAWFGDIVPTDLHVGWYEGSGVGLSTDGDGVHLFDAAGDETTGVNFGASTDDVTFDNAAESASAADPFPTLTALSTLGRNGAFTNATGELGSPGTVAPDTTAPTITFSGNAGSYTNGDQIDIRCAVTDGPGGSGIRSTTCRDITGTASDFGSGDHTITVTATDNAGNTSSASVTFHVEISIPVDPIITTPTPTPTPTNPAPAPQPLPRPVPKPKPAPKVTATAPKSAKPKGLSKGVTTRLAHLKAKSKVTLTVKIGSKTLATFHARVGAKGTADVKLKLTKKQLAKLGKKTKKLTLKYAVVNANGKKTTLTASLKIS